MASGEHTGRSVAVSFVLAIVVSSAAFAQGNQPTSKRDPGCTVGIYHREGYHEYVDVCDASGRIDPERARGAGIPLAPSKTP